MRRGKREDERMGKVLPNQVAETTRVMYNRAAMVDSFYSSDSTLGARVPLAAPRT